ncbi:phage tail sheath subtilisin-like domain-containing protein [Streptomyces sp. SKN60]|uniref:phage tail sheath subtilisin-like domain-containing protein n=1 Tax=Streptomyces sp. SKN60 TaxID=2855506 RepID=UPI00224530B1|nr:phage tail sheath subtilisin-like domain-containing protein [Streptomyces sp. SKN60]MCX2183913.1 phage tail sheath subtilisin-like domain-containing protein [Streptomyces sp. SKN60]
MSYQSPGVYIEEVPSGPQPIAAASTSVVAAIGSLCKGPVGVPTRVTGWADFVRTFGTAHARGFTPEALYGFFENGGTAAWVVRADPSVAATWKIYDSATTATLSFEATATSPGAWANGVTLGVSPDLTGGAGAMAQAVVSSPVSVQTNPIDIPVRSSGGFLAGDTVTLMKGTGASVDATVNTVAATTLNVTAGTAIELATGDVVAARTAASPTTILLASGSGLKQGDLLAIQSADGSRVTGVIAAVVKQGPRTAVTLSAPLGSAVLGAGLARRIARFRGTIAGGAATFTLGQITWEVDPALAPVDSEMSNARATVSSGVVAAFAGTQFAMPGGQNAPAGTVLVDAQVSVAVYTEAIDFAAGTVEDVLARFAFLPVGTSLELTDGVHTTTVTRTDETTGTESGDDLPQTFTSARFVLPANASNGVVVRCAVPPQVGEFVDFAATKRLRITKVTKASGAVYVLKFAEATDLSAIATSRFPLVAFSPTTFFPVRFNLTVTDGGAVAESHTGLALDPSHPRYFARDGVVNGVSAYVTVAPRAAGAAAIGETTTPAYALSAQAGVDVAPANADFRKALTKLEEQQEPSQVICPDSVTLEDPLLQADLVGAVVDHCEAFRRFAILDAPDFDETALVTWRNQTVASTCAAVYAPHLKMVAIDPYATERFRTVPPSGFVAGVFARTDRERGVAKAPANEQVGGIVGLSRTFTPRHQDLLNPAAVNLLRAFPGRGIRIWGARTATDDVTWRYVNVRRLFNFVERSVENATQWVVFEPNTASTWIRIKVSLEGFLDQLWRAGALAGGKPEEAYRVSVGLGETMTAADIDLGLVITEVALAPAKPAEFVIFRFSHKRQSE